MINLVLYIKDKTFVALKSIFFDVLALLLYKSIKLLMKIKSITEKIIFLFCRNLSAIKFINSNFAIY